jgi:hypothetical protein
MIGHVVPSAPTSVGFGRLARRVTVAHRLIEPGAPAGHGRDSHDFAEEDKG